MANCRWRYTAKTRRFKRHEKARKCCKGGLSSLPSLADSAGPGPGRASGKDALLNRAVIAVGARQVAGAHQHLADDFRPGEAEGAPEQLDPLAMGQRMMVLQPAVKAA